MLVFSSSFFLFSVGEAIRPSNCFDKHTTEVYCDEMKMNELCVEGTYLSLGSCITLSSQQIV